MAAKPASLGDSKVPYRRIQETFELPENRKGVVAKFESILDSGGVQKVTIELGHPIKVERLVKASDSGDVEELPDDDWMNAARNGELTELPPSDKGPYAYLFQAFHLLSQRRLRARIIMVHGVSEVKSWLGLDSFIDIRELFGVEVRSHPEVPDHTALVIASNPDDPDSGIFGVRMILDKPRGGKKA